MPKKNPFKESVREVYQQWPEMELRQKIGFTAGLAVTLSAVFRPALEIHQGRRSEPTTKEFIAGTVLDARDLADGAIVRATDSVTQLGGLLDPLLDKGDFFTKEFFHYLRGNLSLDDLVLRWGRDTVVTATRMWAKAKTDGEIDISAGRAGKNSTALRALSLRLTGTTFERTSGYRQAHQKIATGALVRSGIHNVVILYKGVKAHERTKTASHQAASHEVQRRGEGCQF